MIGDWFNCLFKQFPAKWSVAKREAKLLSWSYARMCMRLKLIALFARNMMKQQADSHEQVNEQIGKNPSKIISKTGRGTKYYLDCKPPWAGQWGMNEWAKPVGFKHL